MTILSNVAMLELLWLATFTLLSMSCLAFLGKNMAADWDFLRECFYQQYGLSKQKTPILEISKSLLQNLQQAFHLLSLFFIYSVN